MSFSIRRATGNDARALSAIADRTFVETFVEDIGIPYPKADLEGFLHKVNRPEVTAQRIADPTHGTWVAEADGRIVGYAVAGPADIAFEGLEREDGMLHRLYVQRAYQGQGLAEPLLKESLAWLGQRYGPRPWLTVYCENVRAQRFYARHGFEAVGEYGYRVGTWTDREIVMRRRPQPA